MKKIILALIPLAFLGCAGRTEFARLHGEVDQNHEDMHEEDYVLAEAINKLSVAIRMEADRIDSLEHFTNTQQNQLEELLKFKQAHDERWPKLGVQKKKKSTGKLKEVMGYKKIK